MRIVLLCICFVGLLGCQEQSQTQAIETKKSPRLVLQDFPKVEQSDRRLHIQIYDLRLELEVPQALRPYPNAEVPWINPQQITEQSGTIMTFLRNQDPTNLQSPNLRLSYILKSPGQENIGGVFSWLDQQMQAVPGSRALATDQEIKNAHGIIAYTREFFRPSFQQNGQQYSQKYMGFCYMDFHPSYMLSLNLTALDSVTYVSLQDDFMQIIMSISKVE